MNLSLALLTFQAGGLLPVVQPFVKNDALFGIEKFFFERCLLLGSICFCRWLPLFQNCNEPVFTRWGKIADLAGVQECHGIFNGGKIGRFVLLRFLRLRLGGFFRGNVRCFVLRSLRLRLGGFLRGDSQVLRSSLPSVETWWFLSRPRQVLRSFGSFGCDSVASSSISENGGIFSGFAPVF